MAGFVTPSSGSILVEGKDISATPAFQRNFGVVFQSYALFPHLTVFENVAFGLRRRRRRSAEIDERVRECLEIVRLGDFAKRLPSELSGGQQQRVAIARAIAFEPQLLLLDEPMSNLDAQLRASMRSELLRIVDRIGVTTICVTHDQGEALSMSDRVVVLARGAIQQIGAPQEVYHRPGNEFVANFIGQSNALRYRGNRLAEGWHLDPANMVAPDIPGADEVLLLRPEDIGIELDRGGRGCLGRVRRSLFMGSYSTYAVDIGGIELLVQKPADRQRAVFQTGDQVRLTWHETALISLNRRRGES
jgi:ABC-type Fe3+/spermidine/putrescine transport system ATPase subunit